MTAIDLRRLFRKLAGRFQRSEEGIAAVEGALLLPVAIAVMGLVVYGGEGLAIQRKVTLASRTLADLVGQATVSTTANAAGQAAINQTTVDYYLSMAALIVYPYDASAIKAEVSEVKVTSGGAGTAVVVWSEGYNGGQARSVGQIIDIDPSIATSGNGYLILGEVQYAYTPIGLHAAMAPVSISDSLFMSPRTASNITMVAVQKAYQLRTPREARAHHLPSSALPPSAKPSGRPATPRIEVHAELGRLFGTAQPRGIGDPLVGRVIERHDVEA